MSSSPSPAAAPGGSAPADKRPDGSALDEYYRQWEHKVAGMKQAAAAVDWSAADWSKLKPSDIGVHVGPVMTEEQFKEYRKRTGSSPHVLRAPAQTSTEKSTAAATTAKPNSAASTAAQPK